VRKVFISDTGLIEFDDPIFDVLFGREVSYKVIPAVKDPPKEFDCSRREVTKELLFTQELRVEFFHLSLPSIVRISALRLRLEDS
jgi:hypothetical protein